MCILNFFLAYYIEREREREREREKDCLSFCVAPTMAYINGFDLIRAIGENEEHQKSSIFQLDSIAYRKDIDSFDPTDPGRLIATKIIHPGPIQTFAFRVDQLSNGNTIHGGPSILLFDTSIETPNRYTERHWVLISGEKDTLSVVPKNQLVYYDRTGSYEAENASLEVVSYNRSFIIRVSKKRRLNFEFFKLLSRSAEKNRYIIWNGYLCCHIVYLSAKNDIKPREEIVYSKNKEKGLEAYIYLFRIRDKIALFDSNDELVEFLLDIIPFFIDKGSSRFALYYKARKFASKWSKKELSVNLTNTVEEMIHSVIEIARLTNKWIKLESKEGIDNIVDFIEYIIHSLNRYINAAGYDQISKRLFQCSYINCYATENTKKMAYEYIYKEKLNYSQEVSEVDLNSTKDWKFDRKKWFSNDGYKFFLIPVLGESNILYRDCLYFMTKMIYHDQEEENEDDKENDKLEIDSKEAEKYSLSRATEKEKHLLITGQSSFTTSLEHYDKMVVFHGAHKTRRLMLPLKIFINSIVCMEFEDYYYDRAVGIRDQSYNVKDLKVEFIYAHHLFTSSLRVSDFVRLVRIYARLYYILRLLPVPQLEDKWVLTVFARYFKYFLIVCDLFIREKKNLQIMEPIKSEKQSFDNNVAISVIERSDSSFFKYKEYKTQLRRDSKRAKNITIASILDQLVENKTKFPLVSCRVDFETDLLETIPKRLGSSDFLSLQLTKIRTKNDANKTQFPVYRSEAFIFKFMKFKEKSIGTNTYDTHSAQAINECEAYKVIKAFNIEQHFPVICDIVLMHELPEESAHSYPEIKSTGKSKYFVIKMELLDWILEDKWPRLTQLEKTNYLLDVLDILDKTLLQHNDLFFRQIGFKRNRLVLLDLGLSDFVAEDRYLDASKKLLAYNDAIFMVESIVNIRYHALDNEVKKTFDNTNRVRGAVTKSSFSFAYIRNILIEMKNHFSSTKRS